MKELTAEWVTKAENDYEVARLRLDILVWRSQWTWPMKHCALQVT